MQEDQAGDIANIEDQLDTHLLKKRSIIGALAFTSRTAILQAVALIAVFLLTIFLSPEEYGIFFVVDATVSFLVYFSDIGLAAALIQKKSPLTRQDLATTFTVQQLLVFILVSLGFIFAPQISRFYNYGPEANFLYHALIISFFLSSLKTIPSILLERELKFNRLVIPQILENLSFYGVAVFLAWQGRGVVSFGYAVYTRAFIGLVAIYVMRPWLPRLGFNLTTAKSLISFGAPFQLNSILSLFKDRLLIIFLGKVLSPTAVGYLGWAEKWAMTPIRFFAEPILKVTFPAYSRLQDRQAELKKAIEKSIFFVSFLVFPAVFGLIASAPHLLALIPRYSKWQPALIALGLYGINALFSSISITLTNTLNATGRVRDTLKLMVMWTILTWVLTPSLMSLFGYNGVALASAITATSSLVGYIFVKKIIHISILPHTLPALASSILMALVVTFTFAILPSSLPVLLFTITIGAATYILISLIIAKNRIFSELAILTKYLKHL